MKIRILDEIGELKVGDIVDAAISYNKETATTFDKNNQSWWLYNDRNPMFEIVEEENKDITDDLQNETNERRLKIPVYSLDELKELKELFK